MQISDNNSTDATASAFAWIGNRHMGMLGRQLHECKFFHRTLIALGSIHNDFFRFLVDEILILALDVPAIVHLKALAVIFHGSAKTADCSRAWKIYLHCPTVVTFTIVDVIAIH